MPAPTARTLPAVVVLVNPSTPWQEENWTKKSFCPYRRLLLCSGALLQGHGVPSPPAWLLQALAQRLRRKTGLSLFNFDVIVPMHCHRRLTQQHSVSPHGTGSGAAGGAGTPNGGSPPPAPPNSIAAAAAAALAAVQADAPAAAACEHPALEEEPAVLNLTAASAASAAAAAVGTRIEGHCGGVAAGGNARHHQQQAQHAQQGPGQQEELLYHLIDINYFPGRCPGLQPHPRPSAAPRCARAGAALGPLRIPGAALRAGAAKVHCRSGRARLLLRSPSWATLPVPWLQLPLCASLGAGYEKMPNYEQYMVQFLRSVCFRDQAQQHEAAGQRQAAGQAAQQAQQQQAQLAPEPAAAGPAQRQGQLEQEQHMLH